MSARFGGASEKCTACSKTVYATEKIVVEDKEDKKIFHKTCLKCTHCNVTLSLGNYAAMQGVFYCKPHFKQLFAAKGNYDEGFGKEKTSTRWTSEGVAPSSAPRGAGAFVPLQASEERANPERKETPPELAAKFSRGGERCNACGKTVYLTEKLVVEDKDEKKTFHKSCLKCTHCQVVLSLGNYAAMQGVFYCKPHFKQLFAAKGNYDEGFGKEKSSKYSPVASTAGSFVPVQKDELNKEKKEAPSNLAGKFKSGGEKCASCGKTVYLTEKVVVEDKEEKTTFHKSCLKCSYCQVVLNLGNYASLQGVLYCKPHFKQLYAVKGNFEDGFRPSKPSSYGADSGQSEAPVENDGANAVPDPELANHHQRLQEQHEHQQADDNSGSAEEPAYEEPEHEKPEEPAHEHHEPAHHRAHEHEEPAHHEPAHHEPAHHEPAHHEPAHHEPAHHEPAHHEPAHHEPAHHEPAHHEPAHHEPAHHEAAHHEPAHHEPAHEEPVHEEPAHEEPAHEEPAYEEPAHEEPAYEEPAHEHHDHAHEHDEPAHEEPAYNNGSDYQHSYEPAAVEASYD